MSTPSLSLIADDAIFMTPGQEPFGKEVFAAQGQRDFAFEGTSDVREVRVFGEWAYLRNFISVAITPAGGKTARKQGYTLTILRKQGAAGCSSAMRI